MMSIQSIQSIQNIEEEFVKIRDFFDKIGFELIGTNKVNDEKIFFVRRKKLT